MSFIGVRHSIKGKVLFYSVVWYILYRGQYNKTVQYSTVVVIIHDNTLHPLMFFFSFCGACLNFSREKDSAIPFPRRP